MEGGKGEERADIERQRRGSAVIGLEGWRARGLGGGGVMWMRAWGKHLA